MEAGSNSAGFVPRRAAASVLLGIATALLYAAVFFGGGSRDGSVAQIGIGVVAALLLAVVLVHAGVVRLPSLDGRARVAAGSAVALVAWTGLTVAWSIAGDRSWDTLNKGLVSLGFLGLGVVVSGLGQRAVRAAAAAVGAVLLLAVLWALAGKAVPALFPDGDRAARLRSPVGYWNGLALLAGASLAFVLWAGTELRGRRWVRSVAAAAAFASVLALVLTASRAGVLGGILAVGLWLALSSARVEGALLALAGALPAVAVSGWAFTRDALVDDGVARADRVSDGALFAVAALLGAAAAAGLALLIPRLLRREERVGRALVAVVAVGAVVGVVALALAVGNPVSWAADEFRGTGGVTQGAGRLTSLDSNNRWQWWQEAWHVARAHPLAGAGANTFDLARRRYRADALPVTQPHSVPLQALADGGVVGLALLLVFAGSVAACAAGALRRLGGGERAAMVPLVVLLAVYALHALVDYDLDFLALTAPAALAAGIVLAAGRRASASRPGRLWLAAALVTGLALCLSLASPALSQREVDRSYESVDTSDFDRAADEARLAAGLDPLSPEPLWARATAADLAGDRALAHRYYEDAARLQPENPETWYQLGLFRQIALGDECAAYQALNAAYTLDPMSQRWAKGGALDRARYAVNHGACEPG